MMRWISSSLPLRWPRKGSVPLEWRHRAVRVVFQFEVAWMVRDENGLVLFPNGLAPCVEFALVTPGHVIGLRDIESASAYPWSDEWREAMHDRIHERLAIQRMIFRAV